MFPAALMLFFGLYPESRRFRRYVVWSLLFTPPIQPTGGAGTAANAFIASRWMGPMRGQSGRSGESEDSDTDKKAFSHS